MKEEQNMSKYEDALYTLLDIVRECEAERCIFSNKEVDEAIDSLEELINREKSMQVNKDTEHIEVYASTYYSCPNCNAEIEKNANYCSHCGQHLDWNDEN